MYQYVWAMCTDLQESGRNPSIESLMFVDPVHSLVEGVLIDHRIDSSLKEWQNRKRSVSCSYVTTEDVGYQLTKGCKYYHKDDATSCFVWFEPDRRYLVDLIENPGCLSELDFLLNGPPSTSISSPLRFPQFRLDEPAIDFKSLANPYFFDCQPLNTILENASTSSVVNEEDVEAFVLQKQLDMNMMLSDKNNQESCLIIKAEPSQLPMPSTANQPTGCDKDLQSLKCRHPYQNDAWKWK
ncbi:hypothetical protein Nepgr_008484 [Nepenthes gracilis]|uniref:EDR1/CTR1/ARMC3-like peptidase-like domain-containing protein n=1 Tax=Nepenthes gracilis TaxID=150966 RepID=A0AAD3XJB2_NEPGR|nr:hypothetical protein Nepgr_008484 [Nepenthes gracilis]